MRTIGKLITWQTVRILLVAAIAVTSTLVATPKAASAAESQGCYCHGWECGDPSGQYLRWCCRPWGTSDCGCTLFVSNCVDQ